MKYTEVFTHIHAIGWDLLSESNINVFACFQEYDYSEDAEEALREMDGYKLDGNRLSVEWAKVDRRGGRDRDRDYRDSRGGGKCYNCGKDGHWYVSTENTPIIVSHA
eukprot:1330104-Amorphochlora_amoeboformis.AAC.1